MIRTRNRARGGGVSLPTIFSIPPAFSDSYYPTYSLYGSGVGGYTSNFNPLTVKPTGTEMFVAVNGNDITGDGTISNPYATITKAILMGAVIVNLRAGIHNDTLIANWNPSTAVALISYDGKGKATLIHGSRGLTWTQQGSPNAAVYAATVVGTIINVVDLDASGIKYSGETLIDGSPAPVPFSTVASVAAAQADPSSWYQSGTTLYVRTETGRAPDDNIVIMNSNAHMNTNNPNTIYIDGVAIWGNSAIIGNVEPGTAIFCCIDTDLRYASNTLPSISLNDYNNVYILRPRITDNASGKGINIVSTQAGAATKGLVDTPFIKRVGNSGATNDQALNVTGNASIICLNGNLSESQAPVFIATTGASVLALGVYAHDSSLTTNNTNDSSFHAVTADGSGNLATIYMKDCKAGGSYYDRVVATGGRIIDLGGFVSGTGLNSGTIIDGTWTPASLDNQVLWYNANREDGVQYFDTFSTTVSSIRLQNVVNLFNSGTYDTTSISQNQSPSLASQGIKNLNSFFGRDNAYGSTTWKPSAGNKTIYAKVRLSNPLGQKAMFGCNDGVSHRFYVQQETSGAITVGMGTGAATTATLYVADQELDIRVDFNSTSFDVWINGVKEINAQAATFTGTSSDNFIFLGRTSTGALTAYFNGGHIGELFVVNDLLSSQELINLEYYIANQWIDRRIYHVFTEKGQSNVTGVVYNQSDYTTTEKPNFRIHQINRSAGDYDEDVILAYEPLKHVSNNPAGLTFGFSMAQAYLARINDPRVHVLFVPCGNGDTGYSDPSTYGRWRVGDDLHENMITRTNVAMAKSSNTVFKALLEFMGEHDSFYGLSGASMETYQEAAIADFRSRVTGAADSAYIVNGLVPEFGYVALDEIELAIADTPNRITNSGYMDNSDLTGMTPDSVHFYGTAQRIIGARVNTKLLSLGY